MAKRFEVNAAYRQASFIKGGGTRQRDGGLRFVATVASFLNPQSASLTVLSKGAY